MSVRWFVEEVGSTVVVSRLNEAADVATFTFDGGRTWTLGDRTPGHRMRSDAAVHEVTEAQARQHLVHDR